ncbi:MAG: class I SAM-dependent methyltransferase [Anaerolineales bacterium]|nr:class I SAM-dependent methyltransferase [Anaerolineales bacterium]
MKPAYTDQQSTIQPSALPRDYLWLHLRELPYFRALMRAVEASFYADLDLPSPLLDVGCGDGHFVTVALERQVDVGLDPWRAPIQEAARRGGYRLLVQADGARAPFPEAYFGSAMSNSVLEHIPDVESVLREVARLLKPGAPFVFCGPNHNFLPSLSLGRALDRVGLRPLGDAYRAFFNRISRHYHSDPPEVWAARLEQAGFELERWWHYYAPQALHVTEWGHYFGLPCLAAHKLTGRWILSPTRWNLALTERITRRRFDASQRQDGVCSFYIARRKRAT